MKTSKYGLFIDTLAEGTVPAVYDQNNQPILFPTERDAQLEIADNLISRLQEFIAGEREFDEAIGIEEYIAEVEVEDE